jgi:hypothetical protein
MHGKFIEGLRFPAAELVPAGAIRQEGLFSGLKELQGWNKIGIMTQKDNAWSGSGTVGKSIYSVIGKMGSMSF